MSESTYQSLRHNILEEQKSKDFKIVTDEQGACMYYVGSLCLVYVYASGQVKNYMF